MSRRIFTRNIRGNRRSSILMANLVAGQIKARKARERIRTWAQLHRVELDANWERMKAGRALEGIEPLAKDKP